MASQRNVLCWTSAKEADLIDLVQEKPALWNPADITYSKKTLKKYLYLELCEAMIERWPEDRDLMNPTAIQMKFNSLKSYFNKEERRLKGASGAAGIDCSSRWIHFHRLQFLRDTSTVEPSETNLALCTEDQSQSVFINGEGMNKDTVSVKDILSLSEMKIQSSNPYVNDVDSEKGSRADLKLDFGRPLRFSKRDERRALRDTERTTKKLENFLKNRGLPVDQEILQSATRKDTFDMRCLNDSLPSASENKKVFGRTSCTISPSSWKLKKHESVKGIRLYFGPSLSATPSPNNKMFPPAYGLVRGSLDRCGFELTAREKRMRGIQPASASANQKKTDEEKSNPIEQLLCFWRSSPSCLVGQTSGLTLTDKLDDKEQIEKTSDVENNLQNREFPPLLTTCLNADLPSPRLSVPLNSPTKWKEDVSESSSALSRAQLLLELQHSRLMFRREANKSGLLNSRRGVSDRSERESTASQRTSKFSHLFQKARRLARDDLQIQINRLEELKKSLRLDMRMQMKLRKRSEYKRNIETRLSLGSRNSDKVIPD